MIDSANSTRAVCADPQASAEISIEQVHEHVDEAVAVLKSLASPNRLLILCHLVRGERTVTDLAQSLDLAQSVVSQHLALLRREGIVAGRREAQSIHYRIVDARVEKLMGVMYEQFCAAD